MMPLDAVQPASQITTVLAIVGVWPLPSGIKWYVRWLPWILHFPFTFVFTILMWLELIWSEDWEQVNNVLYMVLTEMGLFVKILNILWYNRLAVRLMHEWQTNPIYALRTTNEQLLCQRKHKSFAIVFICFTMLCLCASAGILLLEAFLQTRQLPFPIWLPGILKRRYYWYTYCYELFAMPWTCVANTALDVHLCYISYYLSLIFQLIEQRLQCIGARDVDEENFEELVGVILLHQRIINDSKDCERLLSYPILFQIFLSTFVLCCSAYRLQSIQVTENPDIFLALVEYVLSMAFQIFLPCYYANEITLSSEGLNSHLFGSNWVDLSSRKRRLILIYMEYLKRPLVLRAANFFDIGLPLFSKVLNNAYSLLAVLLNMEK